MRCLAFAVVCVSFAVLVSTQSPASKAWTPAVGRCPDGFSLVRSAGNVSSGQSLSPSESAYVSTRRSNILPGAWKAYLQVVQSTNVSLPDYVATIMNSANDSSSSPTLGIATSGGGYRASIFGAAVMNTLDGRNSSSVALGTGGLLQTATYLAGLSGGAWLVSSLTQADLPTFQDLVFGPSAPNASGFNGWLTQFDLVTPTQNGISDTVYISSLLEEVHGKHDAGFAVTANDVWARALARHFTNGTSASDFLSLASKHGAGITWSGMQNLSSFASHELPFPILLTDTSSKHGNASTIISADGDFIPLTNPVYEFNPYEMGSYDPVLSAFTPIQFLGTSNTSNCVTGYDQVSFVAGSSSALFNTANISATPSNNSLASILSLLNGSIPQPGVELDVARYPNPFFGVATGTFIDSGETFLGLVDGGENGENVPLQPLLVKARGVDVLVVIDATADVDNFSSGSALVATANRTSFFPSAYSFPPIPPNITSFAAQNLTSYPSFFGCNSSAPTPLLIYIPNGPTPNIPNPATNTNTTQLQYNASQVLTMMDQAGQIASQRFDAGGGDAEWPACLACAAVDRARNRSGVARTGVCSDCFQRYCWNDTSDASSNGAQRSWGNGRSGLVAGVILATLAALLS